MYTAKLFIDDDGRKLGRWTENCMTQGNTSSNLSEDQFNITFFFSNLNAIYIAFKPIYAIYIYIYTLCNM